MEGFLIEVKTNNKLTNDELHETLGKFGDMGSGYATMMEKILSIIGVERFR